MFFPINRLRKRLAHLRTIQAEAPAGFHRDLMMMSHEERRSILRYWGRLSPEQAAVSRNRIESLPPAERAKFWQDIIQAERERRGNDPADEDPRTKHKKEAPPD